MMDLHATRPGRRQSHLGLCEATVDPFRAATIAQIGKTLQK